jgi:hypothetical protein
MGYDTMIHGYMIRQRTKVLISDTEPYHREGHRHRHRHTSLSAHGDGRDALIQSNLSFFFVLSLPHAFDATRLCF